MVLRGLICCASCMMLFQCSTKTWDRVCIIDVKVVKKTPYISMFSVKVMSHFILKFMKRTS